MIPDIAKWAEIAALLGVLPDPVPDLSTGEPFEGPGGLRCRMWSCDGAAFRLAIGLPLCVDDLPPRATKVLLATQESLLGGGWFLGMDEAGRFQMNGLRAFASAVDVAAAFCEGHVLAWVALEFLDTSVGPAP